MDEERGRGAGVHHSYILSRWWLTSWLKAVDQVRMTASFMAHSVTAERTLWLRHWSADNSYSLCSVPFDGELPFGKTLEAAIQRVSGCKSGPIPQEKRSLFSV